MRAASASSRRGRRSSGRSGSTRDGRAFPSRTRCGFRQALDLVGRLPRFTSIHSYSATALVLEELRRRPRRARPWRWGATSRSTRRWRAVQVPNRRPARAHPRRERPRLGRSAVRHSLPHRVGRAPRGAAARLLRRGGEAPRLGEPGEDHPRHGHGAPLAALARDAPACPFGRLGANLAGMGVVTQVAGRLYARGSASGRRLHRSFGGRGGEPTAPRRRLGAQSTMKSFAPTGVDERCGSVPSATW